MTTTTLRRASRAVQAAPVQTMRLQTSTLKLVSRARDVVGRAEPYALSTFFKFDGAEIKIVLDISLAEVPGILLNPNILRDKILQAKLQINVNPTIVTRATPNAATDATRNIFA